MIFPKSYQLTPTGSPGSIFRFFLGPIAANAVKLASLCRTSSISAACIYWIERIFIIKRARAWQKQQNGMCVQRRHGSDRADIQSDKSSLCALLGSQGPKSSSCGQRRLIRLGGCISHSVSFVVLHEKQVWRSNLGVWDAWSTSQVASVLYLRQSTDFPGFVNQDDLQT